ncbi:MAG TPA: hypothetical protein DEP72_03805 [Clostridiales bacterium]|nr:MAG: hypothetical protein A2Y18_05265 [Clostridiales bacterium GWD2_32_19]HCC07279.1 hypothetical protein [Clostridiales bacterium]
MQKNLRDGFIKLLEQEGIKIKFISDKTGISEIMLSHFKNGRVNLGKKNEISLQGYIEEFCKNLNKQKQRMV